MDRIGRFNIAHKLEKRSLLIAMNCVAGLSIFFFGYDQGMMGGVNTSPNYYTLMGFATTAPNGQPDVYNTILQGGIVAIYYLGTLVGGLFGGWVGDKIGRIKTIALGAAWGIVGASLQTSAQSATWMLCARVVNGVGTGMLNSIVPVWATESAEHTSRGQFVAIEFTLNIFGVVVAYWIEYGLRRYRGGGTQLTWRFPVGFQIILLLMLITVVWFFPESPRWLVKAGREDEARYILGRLRGDTGEDAERAEAEFQDIKNNVELERKSSNHQNSYFHMFFGIGSGKLHTGRRVHLTIWLLIMQEWVGIAVVTIYAPTLFGVIAGFSPDKAAWLSGLNTITYMLSTLICVFTLDKIGRRWTLYWGSTAQGIAMFAAGALCVEGEKARAANDPRADAFGAGGAAFLFIFTFVFGATWLTVPLLYPAEIFPLEVRAKGNAWGVVGWSIGNAWIGLLGPVIFKKISSYAFFIFASCNVISIPMIWALYPETNQRTLEEMNLLFASESPWVWEAERAYKVLKEQNPELVQAAQYRRGTIDSETGGRRRSGHRPSLIVESIMDPDFGDKVSSDNKF